MPPPPDSALPAAGKHGRVCSVRSALRSTCAGLGNMTASANAKGRDTIEVFYSRFAVVAASALLAYALGTIGYWMVLGLFSGHYLALVAAAAAVVGLPMALSFLPALVHAWLHRGPVLIVDDRGVTDVRKRPSFVAWADVRAIRQGSGETASFLCIEFRRADTAKQDLRFLGAVGMLLLRLRSLRDWNVTLRLLACNNRELLAGARRLHQQSIRRQIVALRQGAER